jgi:hypothetical protein
MENQQQSPISAEELAERKAKLSAYYEEQIPFLKKQLEYETLLADLQEQEARRIYSQVKIGQMVASASSDEEEEMEEPAPSKPRSLKKDK